MSNLSQIKADSNWGDASNTINTNFQNMDIELEKLKNSTTKFKGYFTSESNLKNKFPSPKRGDIAFVGEPYPGNVYDVLTDGSWHNTTKAPETGSVDLQEYATKDDFEASQKEQDDKLTELDTKIDKRTTEYNVSVNNPTSGTDESNKYDLSTAIGQVPAELRTGGVTVSFLNESGNTEKWEFSGGSWAIGGFSQVGAKIITGLGSQIRDLGYGKANIIQSPNSVNLLDVRGVNWKAGGTWGSNGVTFSENESYASSEDYQDISYLAGKTVYSNAYKLYIYDYDKKYISSISSYGKAAVMPEKAFYIRISNYCTKISNDEIIDALIQGHLYLTVSKLSSSSEADEYKPRKVISDEDFQVAKEQMPDDYVPTILDNSIGEEKIERNLKDKINNKLDKSFGKNLCNPNDCYLGYILDSSGNHRPSFESYATTGFIPIKPGQILRCNQKYQISRNGLFDANKKVIMSSLVEANSQQYLVGSEESTFAMFSFGAQNLSTIMVEEVASIDTESSEFEPYTEKSEICNVTGFKEEYNHPILTRQYPFFNKKWVVFIDSIGTTGVVMKESETLFERSETYGYRSTENAYTWHRYVSDYLQLGGCINDSVGGSCISNASTLFAPFCERVDNIIEDETVALVLLSGGSNDWYYNVPMGETPTFFGPQNGDVYDEFDENTLDKGQFKSAYAYVILKLQKKYPNAVIVAATPYYKARLCNGYEGNTDEYNKVGKNKLGFTCLDYFDAAKEIAGLLGIPIIDCYRTSGINCGNWRKFLSDGTHPWVADGVGLKMYARCLIGGLQTIFGQMPNIPLPE